MYPTTTHFQVALFPTVHALLNCPYLTLNLGTEKEGEKKILIIIKGEHKRV